VIVLLTCCCSPVISTEGCGHNCSCGWAILLVSITGRPRLTTCTGPAGTQHRQQGDVGQTLPETGQLAATHTTKGQPTQVAEKTNIHIASCTRSPETPELLLGSPWD
jgi:hypothetical protein